MLSLGMEILAIAMILAPLALLVAAVAFIIWKRKGLEVFGPNRDS